MTNREKARSSRTSKLYAKQEVILCNTLSSDLYRNLHCVTFLASFVANLCQPIGNKSCDWEIKKKCLAFHEISLFFVVICYTCMHSDAYTQ